jgi:hypothetical protein
MSDAEQPARKRSRSASRLECRERFEKGLLHEIFDEVSPPDALENKAGDGPIIA